MTVKPPKPEWLKVRAPGGERYAAIKNQVRELGLATVCEEARCPNMGECWGGGTATLMLMGDTCTRGCRFCAVKTNREGQTLDPEEPTKVAGMLSKLDLDYVVLTSVNRDDLPDDGAGHFAATVRAVKASCPKMRVEVLIPDFRGMERHVVTVCGAQPDVIAHNIETVERLTPKVRDPRAKYHQSLAVLATVKAAAPNILAKSSIMIGLGETQDEVRQTLIDLRAAGCEIVTFGQYLQPTPKHLPVAEYIHPDGFKAYQTMAEELGFAFVASGPLVRSSYRAGELFIHGMLEDRNASEVAAAGAHGMLEDQARVS